MKTKTLGTVATILVAASAFAADPTKPALPAKALPALELKNKSSFAAPNGLRNPFQPIGWKPGNVLQSAVATKKVPTDGAMFRVSTIIIGTPSLAVINGRSYEEGQLIRMPKGATSQVRAKVYRIGDGLVQIQVEDTVINVPLDRGKLNELQREELLKTEDE
ncbi:MAG TPA: hypothetical protein VFG14_11075 [Chthoniobacteraceae bacterium]|jgi:hypothetical protein|nr:hypothetical protein [Chthoniobacteraceae bacterium]